MAWEIALFQRTRLTRYKNCLALLEAYSDAAPLWERTLLAAYVGIGPPLARIFGGKTKTLWEQAESIIGDLFKVSELTPPEVTGALRRYVKVKQAADHHLPFETAIEQIYNQSFYPLVTHFTFAFQPSAVARLRFVKGIAAAMAFTQATVADLGCGSGAMLCEVLQLKSGWTGYGLDISHASVEYASRLALHKKVAPRANFQQGDLNHLPFANGSLDLVIASEVIEHLPDPQAVFREISRVLAPGGFLALTVPVDSHTPAHMNSVTGEEEFRALCAAAGLDVPTLLSKWHLTFGDDRRHILAVARLKAESSLPAPVYSLVPQMSSAASSGIVSS